MKIPFTNEQFLKIFETYNRSIEPWQFLLLALGAYAVFLLFRDDENKTIKIYITLAVLWLWSGIVFHMIFFTGINPAAWGFGFFFVLQGLFFLYEGLMRKESETPFVSHPLYLVACGIQRRL